jgi:two-component system chemotaxis response regulator CheY
MTKTILVAEDSESIRQLVTFTLRGAGYDVIEANDGKEALEKIDERTADLVVTDFNMPNMGGVELTKHLRGLEAYQFTPIIMLTTESQKEKVIEGKEAGISGWIIKPFAPEKLIEVIKRLIK